MKSDEDEIKMIDDGIINEVSSVNTDDLDNVVETNDLSDVDDKTLDSDYTKWINIFYGCEIKSWIYWKRNQLFGVKEDDAVYIWQKIEQLVSCYNQDLLDEMYDDDWLVKNRIIEHGKMCFWHLCIWLEFDLCNSI